MLYVVLVVEGNFLGRGGLFLVVGAPPPKVMNFLL